MSRFDVFLRHTGERLALPKATRKMILVELESDLDDLYRHYAQQGLSEKEAVDRAEEKVKMSDEALEELVRVHSTASSWTDRAVGLVQSIWERIAMGLIVLFFVLGVSLGPGLRPMEHVSWFVWPTGVIFLALVVSFILQMARFSKQTNPRRVRDGLATPLFLGAASLVVGCAGGGINLYLSFMRMAADPENAGTVLSRAVLGTTANLSIALLVTLSAAVFWFVLAARVVRLENKAARNEMGVE